jgi:hypothetical protein
VPQQIQDQIAPGGLSPRTFGDGVDGSMPAPRHEGDAII